MTVLGHQRASNARASQSMAKSLTESSDTGQHTAQKGAAQAARFKRLDRQPDGEARNWGRDDLYGCRVSGR